jgi:hypothetical protein
MSSNYSSLELVSENLPRWYAFHLSPKLNWNIWLLPCGCPRHLSIHLHMFLIHTILNDGVQCVSGVKDWSIHVCLVPLSFVPSWKQNHSSNSPLGPYHTLFFLVVRFFSWDVYALSLTCTKGIQQYIALQMRVVLLICGCMALGFFETLHNTIL